MPVLVIVSYRPLEGKGAELYAELKTHVPILRERGLATSREPVLMKTKNGAYLEVFEWASEEAIHSAHSDPVVLEMWVRFGACCIIEPLNTHAEVGDLFASFEPVSLH